MNDAAPPKPKPSDKDWPYGPKPEGERTTTEILLIILGWLSVGMLIWGMIDALVVFGAAVNHGEETIWQEMEALLHSGVAVLGIIGGFGLAEIIKRTGRTADAAQAVRAMMAEAQKPADHGDTSP